VRLCADELSFRTAVVDHKARVSQRRSRLHAPTGSMSTSRTLADRLERVLPLLNRYARIPVCGLIAHYNGDAPAEPNSVAETMLTVLRRSC